MVDSWILLLIYMTVMVSLIVIFIFGRMKAFRGTVVEKALHMMLDLPELCGSIIFACGNRQRGKQRWNKFSGYFTEQRNPTLQIFYCVLVLPAFYGFITRVVPHLHTQLEQVVGCTYCAFGFLTFLIASYAPNGVVGKEEKAAAKAAGKKSGKAGAVATKGATGKSSNPKDTRFHYDGILFTKCDCPTCKHVRPARSKHCRICGHCVRRFDHHCAWLNCDVGEENLRWFHLFLIGHYTLCAYATHTICWFMYHEAERLQLFRATFINEAGERFKASNTMILMYLLKENPVAFGVGAFCAAVSVMLFIFWGMHMKLVLNNTTTNETNKISDVLDYLENRYNFKKSWIKETVKAEARNLEKKEGEVQEIINYYDSLTDENITSYVTKPTFSDPVKIVELWKKYEGIIDEATKKKEKNPQKKAHKTIEKQLKGTFNRGWLKNILEVVFPGSRAN